MVDTCHLDAPQKVRHSSLTAQTQGETTLIWTSEDNQTILVKRGDTYFLNGKQVPLSPRELQLFDYLVEHEATVRSKHMILDLLYGDEPKQADQKIIDVMICHIRKKLGAASTAIKTVWGRGYMYNMASTKEDKRWVSRIKREILEAVMSGETEVEIVLAEYPGLTRDELVEWLTLWTGGQEKALRITKAQMNRNLLRE